MFIMQNFQIICKSFIIEYFFSKNDGVVESVSYFQMYLNVEIYWNERQHLTFQTVNPSDLESKEKTVTSIRFLSTRKESCTKFCECG